MILLAKIVIALAIIFAVIYWDTYYGQKYFNKFLDKLFKNGVKQAVRKIDIAVAIFYIVFFSLTIFAWFAVPDFQHTLRSIGKILYQRIYVIIFSTLFLTAIAALFAFWPSKRSRQ
jgi:hypothetical protein